MRPAKDLKEAQENYERATLLQPECTVVKISLKRVEEKMQRILLCIDLDVSFYDGLPERDSTLFENGFRPIIMDVLFKKGYRVIVLSQSQKEKLGKMIEEKEKIYASASDRHSTGLISGRAIYGKVNLTLRKFRPESFNLVVAEGNIRLSAANLLRDSMVEISDEFNWNCKAEGNGETEMKAVDDFFAKNRNSIRLQLEHFFGKLGSPEQYFAKLAKN